MLDVKSVYDYKSFDGEVRDQDVSDTKRIRHRRCLHATVANCLCFRPHCGRHHSAIAQSLSAVKVLFLSSAGLLVVDDYLYGPHRDFYDWSVESEKTL